MSTPLRRFTALFMIVAVFLFQSVNLSVALAEESSTTATSSTTTTVGPQGPTGPQGQTGPQGPTGPQGTTGPMALVTPSPAATPTSTPSSATPISTSASATEDGTSASASTTSTGANSDNQTTINQDNQTTIDQTNDADIDNDVVVNANSGNNVANFNTGNGTASSGSITGQVTVINVANSQVADGSTLASRTINGNVNGNLAVDAGTASALTNQTGANSNNLTAISQNNMYQLNVANNAVADNDLVVNANTGNNTANFNTGDGSVHSGDINLALNVINLLNAVNPFDLKTLSIFGDVIGNLLFPTEVTTSNTGANSNNETTINQNNDTTINTENNAAIDNDIAYNLNTGGNATSFNTGGGSVTSGTVNTQTAVTNIANAPANMLYLVNVYGQCDCDLSALDPTKYVLNIIPASAEANTSNTGANSNNETTIDQNNQTAINQTNNATANNMIRVNANTGNNTANGNTGTGKVTSGNINVMTSVANLLNSSAEAGQRLALNIINIFGNWSGKAATKTKPVATLVTPSPVASPASVTVTTATTSEEFEQSEATVATTPTENNQNQIARVGRTFRNQLNTGRSFFSQQSTSTSQQSGTTTSQHNAVHTTGNFDITNTATSAPIIPPTSAAESTTPTQTRTGHWFAEIAQAAEKRGLVGGEQSFPVVGFLAIAAIIWLTIEFGLSHLIKRRNQVQ